MPQEPGLTCVRDCQGFDQAQIYKSKLEALGIPVLLQYESVGPVYGITIDGLGRVRILVPESFAAEARVLLTDLPLDGTQEQGGKDLLAEIGGDDPASDESVLDAQDSALL